MMSSRFLKFTVLSFTAVSCGLLTTANAGEEVRRIDERYAADSITETPDFRQDVVPLLGKLGCNGRACHGSFQGQGGFRLSLFGYDFKSDHEMLTQGDRPRVDTQLPANSLILRKPSLEEPHEGGKRLIPGSWQHKVLARWIESGAKPIGKQASDFVRLEVSPAEIITTKRGETFPLKAVSIWSDGTRVDVTPLCRFQTNNDQIATINDAGVVTAGGPGDSHIVVFYDNGVVPVPVIQPVSDQSGSNYPSVETPTRIDELVIEKLRKLGMRPSDLCSDEEFLRRVSLDMTGTLPTAADVEAFIADHPGESSAQKRAKKIDELLESPAYAAWWATRFADWTGNNVTKLNNNKSAVDAPTRSAEWYEWLRSRIEKNVPYDQLAEGIILAVSRQDGESYSAYCERMSGYYHKDAKGRFADQPSLTYYWSRREFLKPEERAMGFAYTFLGLRIQCAQCHKHPFDQWTKDDFDRFKNFFARVRYGSSPTAKGEENAMLEQARIDIKKLKGNDLGRAMRDHLAKGEVMPFDELFIPPTNRRPAQAAKAKSNEDQQKKRPQMVAGRTAKILGGDEVKIEEMADPREALMEWLRDERNAYFAKAIVNRIWSGYFNVGVVEPADDLSLANPPSNEALLDYLTDEFRHHGYDMKWLHKTIASSRTYQLSWQANTTNEFDERNFARAVPRRLPAEVAYDSLQLATMSDSEAAKWHQSTVGRAIATAATGGRGGRGREDYALSLFGRSTRESNCECDRSSEASLLQTVYLRNDSDVLTMIGGKDRWVDQILKETSVGVEDAKAPRSPNERQPLRLAQLKAAQLKRRLENAKEKGNSAIVEAIEKELAKREQNQGERAQVDVAETPSEMVDVKRIVRQAYLRTLSRYPTEWENDRAARYFDEAGDVARGIKDLLWALVNTKEFVLNH